MPTRGVPSTVHGIPVPLGTDPNAVPTDLGAAVSVIEQGSIVRRLTQAQIDALTAPQRPIGLMVHNLTRQCPQVWDGATWVDVQLAPKWTPYSPRLRRSGTDLPVRTDVSWAEWARIGSVVHVSAQVSSTAVAARAPLLIGLPVAPARLSIVLGVGQLYDSVARVSAYGVLEQRSDSDGAAWAQIRLATGGVVGEVDPVPTPSQVTIQATYKIV